MKKTGLLIFLLLFFVPLPAEPVFSDMSPYIEGRAPAVRKSFGRLPLEMKDTVRAPVWRLSLNTAGLAAHFITDATELHLRWKLLNNFHMNHMPGTGIRGLDLYVRQGNDWFFVATARPSDTLNTVKLISGMTAEKREYLLYCPLYDGLQLLELGTNESALLLDTDRNKKPLLFYGTSITQGGCVSRPGMAYPAIAGRRLERESINLGFSGNGRMDPEVMDFIAGTDAACFILDCLPNMNSEMIRRDAETGIRKILNRHPKTPVLLIPNIMPEDAKLNLAVKTEILEENAALEAIYHKLKKEYRNLHYLPYRKIRDVANEGTVDGIHLTDLGQSRMADVLVKEIGKLIRSR